MSKESGVGLDKKIAVIGLGYVGLPLAVELSKSFPVVGFDICQQRIVELKNGNDRTLEVPAEVLSDTDFILTDDLQALRGVDIYIVTVPTPVHENCLPDFSPLQKACQMIGSVMTKGSIVVFESTVYPGVTRGMCGALLQEVSGLVCEKDFFLGYSPERINPGDHQHRLHNMTKVVAGSEPWVTEVLVEVYGAINKGDIFKAKSIEVAEAAKVLENTQRDINVAFMNEVAMICQKLDISVYDVLDVAETKWNFLPFRPGLVGGHCIGVDPYYWACCARQKGIDPHLTLSGRQTNESMSSFLVQEVVKRVAKGKVAVLGLTFKEDIPDLRNTKVMDLIAGLKENGYEVDVFDPLAYGQEAEELYGITLSSQMDQQRYQAIIAVVPHQAYRQLSSPEIDAALGSNGWVIDLKGMWRDRVFSHSYWCL